MVGKNLKVAFGICGILLAYVPIELIDRAINFLVSLKPNCPQTDKFVLFYNYFRSTWLEGLKFPPSFWNHYETIGPKSNNYVEGYNLNLNNDIDSVHPNIFGLIGTLKANEVLNSMNYIRLIQV